jgi:polyhydroxybutyrate depolymerase
MRRLLLVALVFGLAASLAGTERAVPAPATQRWQLAGRTVLALVPDRPTAVVVLLHSYTHDPDQVLRETGVLPVARQDGWLLAVPAGLGSSWNAGGCCGYARDHHVDDLAVLHAIIGALLRRVGRPVPVVVAGSSNGGMLALLAACSGERDISAVVAVAGNLQSPACPHPGVPFLTVRGARDALVPIGGSSWSAFLRTRLLPDATGQRLLTAGCEPRAHPAGTGGVTVTTWSCPAGTSRAYVLAGGGHGWPRSGTIDATRLLRSEVADAAVRPVRPTS